MDESVRKYVKINGLTVATLRQEVKRDDDLHPIPSFVNVDDQTSIEIPSDHVDVILQSTSDDSAMELTNETTELVDLNDDCLRVIFKLLTIPDLCAIAEASTKTSIRLKVIATEVFRRLHKSWCFDHSYAELFDKTKRIFCNFGSAISEIEINFAPAVLMVDQIDSSIKKEDVIDLLVDCCSNTLESLTIKHYEIPEDQALTLSPLFNNLQKLCLIDCTIAGAGKNLLANCKSLVELDVTYNQDDNGFIFDNTFPKLENFTYLVRGDFDLENFIVRHKNLKTFAVNDPLRPYQLYKFNTKISDNCTHVKELVVSVFGEYEKYLEIVLKFQHLNKLTFICLYESFTNFIHGLTSLKSLEYLYILCCDLDAEFVPALAQLKQLRELHICGCRGDIYVNQLSGLDQLQYLRLFTGGTEFDIANAVQSLINLKSLLYTGKMGKETCVKIENLYRDGLVKPHHRRIVCITDDYTNGFQEFQFPNTSNSDKLA